MTWWEKLKRITTREAAAVREELAGAANKLDEALAKKERELNATPSERVEMLLEEIDEEQDRFGDLETKLRTEGAERATRAGIDPPVPAPMPERDLSRILASLDVRPIPIRPDHADKTSHVVSLSDEMADTIGGSGFDSVVADLQVDVMVLDATRRGHAIALRTPTLTVADVEELVAGIIADHAPGLAAAAAESDPSSPGASSEGPGDLAD